MFNKYNELQSHMQLTQLTSHYKYTNQHLLNMLQIIINNNNNNPTCKAPECQKTSVALADRTVVRTKPD